MKQKISSIISQLKLPELRSFWIFVFLAIIFLLANISYIPKILAIIDFAALSVLGAIIFLSNLRLVTSNIEAIASSRRLKGIIANLSDGVIAYDNNFKILVFNRAAEEIFDLRKSQIIGKNFGPEKARDPKLKLLAQAIFPSLAPVVVRRSEAGIYPQVFDISFPKSELRISTDKIVDTNNNTLGFVKIIRDRTREVELLKAKSDFIAIAAHQLRTPLTAINWIFEGLEKNTSLEEEDKEMVVNGHTAAIRLLKIVNDLLDVSKIEEGRFGYSFKQTNIVDFLNGILLNAQITAKKYGVKLYFAKGSDASLSVVVDPDRLGLALSNLIDNAIKYNVKNGSVTVRVEKLIGKPYIKISIKDTGIGIPPQDMKKVFTKFFRAENVIKKETDGSGLGLYITKNIINRHGGTIWAESTVNRGTSFYFTIPTDPKLIPPKEFGIR